MDTVTRMLKACREQLRDDFPDYNAKVRDRDVEHLYWTLDHMRDIINNRPASELTPGNFFFVLDGLAMGVPYPKEAWQAACREVV